MAVHAGPVVVTEGLVLYLDAANSASYTGISTWYDLSDYRYNATLFGSPSFDSTCAGAITLNGSSQYIAVPPNATHDNLGTSTFDFWFYADTYNAAVANALVTKRTDTANGFFIFVWNNSSRRIVTFDFGGSTYRWLTQIDAAVGIWSNLVFTKDVNSRKMYINGILTTSISDPGAALVGMTTSLFLGKNQSSDYYFDGMIASFKLYNRALSDIEIRQNFETLRSRFGI